MLHIESAGVRHGTFSSRLRCERGPIRSCDADYRNLLGRLRVTSVAIHPSSINPFDFIYLLCVLPSNALCVG